ncbi:MAG: hypothetical protein BFD77_04465 [Pseudomonas sp. CO183]|nr:MAG: hypothetical protein BFD77_04465 [Pseudomonas sp. CO183]
MKQARLGHADGRARRGLARGFEARPGFGKASIVSPSACGPIHIARGLEKLAGLFLLGCGVKLTLN